MSVKMNERASQTDLHVQWRRWGESTFPVHFKSQIVQVERLRLGFIEHSQDRNCGSNLETAMWHLMFFSWHPDAPERQVWFSLERNDNAQAQRPAGQERRRSAKGRQAPP